MKHLEYLQYFEPMVLTQATYLAKELVGKKVTFKNDTTIRIVTQCYLKADGTIWFALDNNPFLYKKEQLNVLFEIELRND